MTRIRSRTGARSNTTRNFICLLVALLLSSLAVVDVATAVGDDNDDGFVLAGYLPDYRLRAYLDQQRNAAKKKPTTSPITDLIIYSLQPHARGFFGCCLQEDHYELVEEFVNTTINLPFESEPSMRVWVTLGGGGRTEAFPEICASNRLRQRLIGSVMTLRARHPFIGGIDLDFFQPRTVQERDNALLFLSEAIPRWHREGLKVSLTLHPRHGRMIPKNIYQLLDRIHFMAYDMIDASITYHANLDKTRLAIEDLLQPGGGLDTMPHKVLLGIPAYARHLRDPANVKTFGEIYDGVEEDNESSSSSLLDSALNSWKGFEWESPPRIQAKIDMAKKFNLGGVFFWELGQDKITNEHPNGFLLEAASAASPPTKQHGTGEL